MTTFPVYWHPFVEVTQMGRIGIEGRETKKIIIGTHTGTNLDAPRHFIKNGVTIDQIPAQDLVGQALVVNLSHKKDYQAIEIEDLQDIPKNKYKIIILKYNWCKNLGKKKYYVSHPYLSENAAKFILKKGVKMKGPETVFFSKDTKIGKNVEIEPYVVFADKVKIGNNVKILSFSHLEGVKIDNDVSVGPYARLRPGTKIKSGSKIGNFVEVKKSTINKNSKVNHLSYIGDALVGKEVNIGAGTITCNYDGRKKSKTNIKDKVFVGSNTSLVAPVTLNEKSVIGAGSVITKNVSKGSLALTRSNQKEKKSYRRK